MAPAAASSGVYPGKFIKGGICERYEALVEINRGATCAIWLGRTEQGRLVALKVLNKQVDQHPRGVSATAQLARNEIKVASTLHHENVAELLDVCATGTQLVLVWELIRGPDLIDFINASGGRVKEAVAAFYFRQLLRAVTAMHEAGVCHRDLKPENCMIEAATHTLKVVDFGVSKELKLANTMRVGTPDYMAPEMLTGAPPGQGLGLQRQSYEPSKVDVWGVGVILYLMICGAMPFEDPSQPDSLARTLRNIQGGRMRPVPASTSSGCRDLIHLLLAHRAEQRLTLAQAASHPWLVGHTRSARVPPHTLRQKNNIPTLEELGPLEEAIAQSRAQRRLEEVAAQAARQSTMSARQGLVAAPAAPASNAAAFASGSRAGGSSGEAGPSSARGTPTPGASALLPRQPGPPRGPLGGPIASSSGGPMASSSGSGSGSGSGSSRHTPTAAAAAAAAAGRGAGAAGQPGGSGSGMGSGSGSRQGPAGRGAAPAPAAAGVATTARPGAPAQPSRGGSPPVAAKQSPANSAPGSGQAEAAAAAAAMQRQPSPREYYPSSDPPGMPTTVRGLREARAENVAARASAAQAAAQAAGKAVQPREEPPRGPQEAPPRTGPPGEVRASTSSGAKKPEGNPPPGPVKKAGGAAAPAAAGGAPGPQDPRGGSGTTHSSAAVGTGSSATTTPEQPPVVLTAAALAQHNALQRAAEQRARTSAASSSALDERRSYHTGKGSVERETPRGAPASRQAEGAAERERERGDRDRGERTSAPRHFTIERRSSHRSRLSGTAGDPRGGSGRSAEGDRRSSRAPSRAPSDPRGGSSGGGRAGGGGGGGGGTVPLEHITSGQLPGWQTAQLARARSTPRAHPKPDPLQATPRDIARGMREAKLSSGESFPLPRGGALERGLSAEEEGEKVAGGKAGAGPGAMRSVGAKGSEGGAWKGWGLGGGAWKGLVHRFSLPCVGGCRAGRRD